MTGFILDAVLMLLLVVALGYGVRLEKKLAALRVGQLAFAGAVTELNAAAGRAENALGSLRDAAEEADMLHDRILKARAVKQELEILCNRAVKNPSVSGQAPRSTSPSLRDREETAPQRLPPITRDGEGDRGAMEGLLPHHASPDDDRALRMAALAERIQGMASPKAPGRDNVSAILGALNAAGGNAARGNAAGRNAGRANHAAQHSPNRPRTTLDDDLFAA